MRLKNLPKVKVNALEKAFKRAKDTREKTRCQALWLLTQGYKRREVVKIVGRSKQALAKWVSAYNKKGLEGLDNKPQPGNHRKLTRQQKQRIKKLITTNRPEKLGLEGKFWTVPTIKRMVKERFKVTYKTDDSYRRLFHFCGFSFHKPNKVNKKRNSHMVRRFEEKLKKDSRGIRDKIVWYW